MSYGCSECLTIAIESERPELLQSLLNRPNISYRDMFWAPLPINWEKNFETARRDEYVPILHEISWETDLSYVGLEVCGHKSEDVELLATPIENTEFTNQFILVSLPMFARWHSSESFPAEQMLRASGKFDFTELQFFHIQIWSFLRREHIVLAFFEEKCFTNHRNQPNDQKTNFLLSDGMTAWGRFAYVRDELELNVHLSYLRLPQLFHKTIQYGYSFCSREEPIQELFKVIESGAADLNNYWTVQCSINASHYRNFAYRGLLSYICMLWDELHGKISEQFISQFAALLSHLLRHGLAYFLGEIDVCIGDFSLLYQYYKLYFDRIPEFLKSDYVDHGEYDLTRINYDCSFFKYLFSMCGPAHRDFCRGTARQLLVLGFGRSELHPHHVPLYDEHLNYTRAAIRTALSDRRESYCASELQSLVDSFDAGPLTLQQLARITVRRAVGGLDFARRINSIAQHMPRALYNYVADPTELMLQPTCKKTRLE